MVDFSAQEAANREEICLVPKPTSTMRIFYVTFDLMTGNVGEGLEGFIT